jgi:hypothetical protein
MNRTVPRATSEEIQLYRSTLYSLLRSSAEIKIRTLEEVHAGMNSLMHPGARHANPDISAFIYSTMRLPDCMPHVKSVILGQNTNVFHRNGILGVENWKSVSARARRRRCFYDGSETLACFIASRSDIEDVIPALTAYQMEWNKIHLLLAQWPRNFDLATVLNDPIQWQRLIDITKIQGEDLERLKTIWRDEFVPNLKLIQAKSLSINLRLLGGSLTEYMKATHEWFENIKNSLPDILERPLYFVSSNTHSLTNILTGFALQHEAELSEFIQNSGDPDLQTEWGAINSGLIRSNKENFLYYVLKKYQGTAAGSRLIAQQLSAERDHGITRVQSERTFEVEAQIIELNQLDFNQIDNRLAGDGAFAPLKNSDALILNIDYPLGLAIYNILSTISTHTDIRGVYVMGKAASLNAAVGDVIIPTICQDEHSHNTYLIHNYFCAADVAPLLKFGTVLDNQKAVTVLGTFLQNSHIMEIFFSEGFADIEMELGNVCSAMYEASRPKRYPTDEIVNLQETNIDLGVLHYVSDTPMSKGKNLGAGTLSYFGMDSTYACSIAILRRIMQKELERLKE